MNALAGRCVVRALCIQVQNLLRHKPCYLLELTLAGKRDNTDNVPREEWSKGEETFQGLSLEDLLLRPATRPTFSARPGTAGTARQLCSIKLRALNLSRRGLTGELPAAIGGWTEMTQLKLGNNPLSGGIPSTIGQLVKLQALSIENCGLTGRHLQSRCRPLVHQIAAHAIPPPHDVPPALCASPCLLSSRS